MIESDGEVVNVEADHAVLVRQEDGNITVSRINAGTSEAFGLLKMAELHTQKEWELNNKK